MSQIDELIRKIARKGEDVLQYTVMCIVTAVNGVTCDCSPINGEADFLNVKLVAEEDATNFILIPVIGSVVGVANITDSENTDTYVCMFSKIDSIKIRGDQFGGVPKSPVLADVIKDIKDDINNLKQIFLTTWTPVANDGGAALKAAVATWAGQSLSPTTQSDIENDKVKHG